MRKVSLVVAMAGIAAAASAQQIANRATLNTILGGGGTTDNFEAFNVGVGNAVVLDITNLNSNSIANGQGPGLVNPGASYSSGSLQWNGDQYFGMTSQAILGDATNITIAYSAATTAMGLDMQAFFGYADTAQISVYDTNNSLIFSTSMALPNDASDVFFGYQSASGIGSVVLAGTNFSWSPNIDDHTYGVPAPSSLALVGVGAMGLVRRRR